MEYNLVITKEAEEDLDQINNYILNHFLSPQAAENTMNNIKSGIKTILKIPDLGIDVSERLAKPFSLKHKLRMLPVGNYLIFYIIDNQTIAILRVTYQHRNWIELFK